MLRLVNGLLFPNSANLSGCAHDMAPPKARPPRRNSTGTNESTPWAIVGLRTAAYTARGDPIGEGVEIGIRKRARIGEHQDRQISLQQIVDRPNAYLAEWVQGALQVVKLAE